MHYFQRFAFLFIFFIAAGCGDCGSETSTGSATVVIDSIEPAGGYPGVEIEVAFTITPGDGTNEADMNWQIQFGDGTNAAGRGASGTSKHTYESAGQYDIDVQAWFDDQKVGNAVQAFRVYSPVDLQIDGLTGSPANIRVGENLQVAFNVNNLTAAEVFTGYEVEAYLSTTPINTADGLADLTALGTTTVLPDIAGEAVLASGGSRNSAFGLVVPNDLPSGDYYVIGHLDPRTKIADTDLSNNVTSSASILRIENPSDAVPDASVRGLFAIPDRAFPQLSNITRGFTLANTGGQDAFDVVHKTYLSIGNDTLDDDDLLIDTSDPVDVFANDTIDVVPEQIVLQAGSEIVPPAGQELQVWVIVTIDTDPDSDTSNNMTALTAPIIVTDEPVVGPDIVATNFTVSPDSTFLNGPLEISAEISNEGTVGVGTFFCGVYLGSAPKVDTNNDPRLANVNIPKLESNASINIAQSITVPGLYDPGVYYMYMVCDPLNALQESFRSNNASIYLSPITLTDEADVDVFVSELTFPASAPENDIIDVVAKVCVSGTNPSGATQIAFYQTPGSSVDFNLAPLLVQDVSNINPGDCEDVTFQITATCDNFISEYSFGVGVDSDARLPENDETNNRKSSDAPIQIAGTFCTCIEEANEPNDSVLDAKPLNIGPSPGGICTTGNCDFYEIALSAGDSMVVKNTFNSAKGELITKLFGPGGTTLLSQDGDADNQEVGTFIVAQDDSYFVQVCGSTATDRNLYDLDLSIFPQSAGRDLLPYDFVLPAGDSFSIGARLDVSFRVYNLGVSNAISSDARFVISTNEIIGDGDDVVISSIPVPSISSGGFTDLNAEVKLPATLMDGDYYIGLEIDPFNNVSESNENNNIILSNQFRVRTICFDSLEPNDNFGDAVDVNSQTYSNLISCKAAPDYYRICAGDAKKFDVSIAFNGMDGDVDMELFNDQFQLVDSSASAGTDIESVSVDYVNGAQCFYVHVYVTTNDPDLETLYDLSVNIQDVDPSLKCSSVFEPNDSFVSASSFLAAINFANSLDRCPVADSDFYTLNLSAGDTVSLSATKEPANQAGTLRLQVYLPNQTPGPNIETAPGVPNATITNYTAPQSGTFFVQVTASGSTRNVTYRLSATGLNGIDLSPLSLSIGPGSYNPNDQVRWGFDLTNLLSDNATTPPYSAYFGRSATFNAANDTLLGNFSAPTVGGNASSQVFGQANVPANAQTGTNYLHIVVDPADTLNDANLQNNIATIPVPTN